MDEEFQILRIKRAKTDDDTVKAFVEIKVGSVTIREIKILQGEDGFLFCALPRKRYWSKNFERMAICNLVRIESDLRGKIYSAILARWAEFEKLKFQDEGGEKNDQD